MMKEKISKKNIGNILSDEEGGALIIEATYCLFAAVLVMMILLSFGFYIYEKCLVQTIADEAAEEAAQTYKYGDLVDDSEDVITADIVSEIKMYRYIFSSTKLTYSAESKALNSAAVHITKTSFGGNSGVTVEVEPVTESIGRIHYEVTVTHQYSFMLADMLSAMGMEDALVISSTAYSESFDAMNYVSSVKAVKYISDKIVDSSTALKLVNQVLSLVTTVVGTADTLIDDDDDGE